MSDPLEYLFALEQFGIKFGLENIRAIVGGLGHPELAYQTVHIAGTNGKGSVTAIVEAALRAAGYRTGRYTSPHLVDLVERFEIGGHQVREDDLRGAVQRIREVVNDLTGRGVLGAPPTFFEVSTAAAFELFRKGGVQVAVCEVGLGGRLDATNVLSPMASAITSIAFDHETYLGSTLAAIAYEKAGIIKPGTPVTIGAMAPEAEEVITRVARERAAPIRAAETVVVSGVEPDGAGGQAFDMRTPARHYGRVRLALSGRHQIDNARVAVSVLETIDEAGTPVSTAAVQQGLATVCWPGRLERITLDDGREALLDAAHNPAGAATLAAYLRDEAEPRPLVFAAMKDKDASGILRTLAPVVSAVILTRASSHRSADPRELAAIARAVAPTLPVSVEESPADALAAAWRVHSGIVVAGSIFLLGDVLKALGRS